MSFRLSFTEEARQHLHLWQRSGQKKTLLKIKQLLQELQEHPRTGTGKPETLTGELAGKWSRRIDKKNRLLYSIHDDVVVVEVIALMRHYTDK